jgi:RHS repeat-associated protein
LYNGKELVDNYGLQWYHYGARYYDPQLGRWHAIDPSDEAHGPYIYVQNSPVNGLDPNGKETYFVNGAGNDQDKWMYSEKIVLALTNAGISDVKHVPITQGKTADMLYSVTMNSNSSSRYFDCPCPKPILEPNTAALVNVVTNDMKAGFIKSGEQTNFVGYSFGSVVVAHTALELAQRGVTIDNVVLIGSTISTDSELYKALTASDKIKRVIRVDIPNDGFSNARDIGGAIIEALAKGNDINHFLYARPENDSQRQELAKDLHNQGVR